MRVKELLEQQPLTTEQIAEITGWGINAARNTVGDMRRAGDIKPPSECARITKGRSHAAVWELVPHGNNEDRPFTHAIRPAGTWERAQPERVARPTPFDGLGA